MSSSNLNRYQITDSKESNENQELKEMEYIISDNPLMIKNIYPSISIDGKIEKSLLLSNEEQQTFKRKKHSFIKDDNEKSYILSELFLKELIKKPCTLDRNKIIKVMTRFIQNSPLIQKFQKDADSDKKDENNNLSRLGAENLNYMELKKGQVLFRIGDNGDRFYFILSGRVSILKLKEINNVRLNYFEYLDYCMYLISQKEYYIFNKVKNRNMEIMSINSESDVISIYKIFFMKKLKEAIIHDLIEDTKSLIKYLKQYGFKLQDFNIKLSRLEEIENNTNLESTYKKEELTKYLLEKCKPSFNDLMVYESYKDLFQKDFNQKKSFTCFIYKPFLYLGKGLFFGDFALDSDMNKRNATIRAEENTILAFMKSEDYINIFAPRRKSEKMKEINFIYLNYFFGNINLRSFEKTYFHLFSPHEFFRNYQLFDFESPLQGLILLKEGKVSLEIKASIADLHDLVKFIWKNISSNRFFRALNIMQKRSLIPLSIQKRINEYIEEPLFIKMKKYGDKFMEELYKVKTLQVYIFANKEIIGLEEYYLGIPYMMRGTVYGNKISCYQIDTESFENILYQEKQIIFNYVKSSVNKLISLIDRLHSLKINQIKILKNKFENEYSDFIEVNKINNNENLKENNTEINNKSINSGIDSNKASNNKSPIKSKVSNLNPIIQQISLKKNKLNKKLNNNFSPIMPLDKNINISSIQNYKNDSLVNNYNSYISKLTNESNTNNNLISNEEKTSNYENNIIITKSDHVSMSSIITNIKKTNQIKLNLKSQRNLSYNDILNKINTKINLNKATLSRLNKKEKISNISLIINRKISTLRNSPERKKIYAYRNYNINRKIMKNSSDKENDNEQKINTLWFGQKTREIKNLKNVSINDFIFKNNKDKDEQNSIMNNIESNDNNNTKDDKEDIKKIAISNAIKEFYKGIKSRGYSSFVQNKKANTLLKKKNKRKFVRNFAGSISNSVDNMDKNEKNNSNKILIKLPIIKDKNNNIFS